VLLRGNRRYVVGKAVTIDRLGQHRCSRYLFVDALDGVAVRGVTKTIGASHTLRSHLATSIPSRPPSRLMSIRTTSGWLLIARRVPATAGEPARGVRS